jgi:topoisomerase-4 subunit A
VVLSVPEGAQVLAPVRIADPAADWLVAVSNEGRMLVFPVAELPQLARGKGNRILGIPPAQLKTREEFMLGAAVLGTKDELLIHSGKRFLRLKRGDLENYLGERGRRGNKLPRGFQKVDRLETVQA